ncbi:methyltransferase domain-containing protein [Candidatus Sumerlaeota bacterium]|nr:methyltransferase domain-containing protein [Candidatus Sumerlaeota bacterium]
MGFLALFGKKKIDRDQWGDGDNVSRETYRRYMRLSWDETRLDSPQYFERLQFCVQRARGRVLEIGCGIGNMTRWLAASRRVESILAVDAFEAAVEELKTYGLPKTTARTMNLEDLRFDPAERFDTVMLCEVLEHIYPSEEKKMLRALRPHVDGATLYVVSTPIGWLEDPHHVRAFSKEKFLRHLRRKYGDPDETDYDSGYSQCAVGRFRP